MLSGSVFDQLLCASFVVWGFLALRSSYRGLRKHTRKQSSWWLRRERVAWPSESNPCRALESLPLGTPWRWWERLSCIWTRLALAAVLECEIWRHRTECWWRCPAFQMWSQSRLCVGTRGPGLRTPARCSSPNDRSRSRACWTLHCVRL